MTAEQREQEIQKNMRVLKISREEAEQLFEDDYSDEVLPEVQEIEEKAKSMKRHYEQSGKERKPTARERKVDNDKKIILTEILKTLRNIGCEIIGNKTETELYFTSNGKNYTIKLIKNKKKD